MTSHCNQCGRMQPVKADGTFATHSLPKPAVALVVCPNSRQLAR